MEEEEGEAAEAEKPGKAEESQRRADKHDTRTQPDGQEPEVGVPIRRSLFVIRWPPEAGE